METSCTGTNLLSLNSYFKIVCISLLWCSLRYFWNKYSMISIFIATAMTVCRKCNTYPLIRNKFFRKWSYYLSAFTMLWWKKSCHNLSYRNMIYQKIPRKLPFDKTKLASTQLNVAIWFRALIHQASRCCTKWFRSIWKPQDMAVKFFNRSRIGLTFQQQLLLASLAYLKCEVSLV